MAGRNDNQVTRRGVLFQHIAILVTVVLAIAGASVAIGQDRQRLTGVEERQKKVERQTEGTSATMHSNTALLERLDERSVQQEKTTAEILRQIRDISQEVRRNGSNR